jgi:hypothetical protein
MLHADDDEEDLLEFSGEENQELDPRMGNAIYGSEIEVAHKPYY